MNKIEFLEELKQIIEVELPANKVAETISFYDDYITSKLNIKSEIAAIEELGSPRLIAKTIIETNQISNDKHGNRHVYTETIDTEDDDSSWFNNSNQTVHIKGNKWYSKLIIAMIIIFILMIVIILGTFAIKLFFTFGIPIILGIIVIKGFGSLFKR